MDRRHLVWLLPILCALWVGRLMYLRRGPECFPAPITGNFYVHDGQLYWVSGQSILTQPVIGGPIRELAREDPKYQIAGDLTFSKDAILYSMYPQSRFFGSGGGVFSKNKVSGYLPRRREQAVHTAGSAREAVSLAQEQIAGAIPAPSHGAHKGRR